MDFSVLFSEELKLVLNVAIIILSGVAVVYWIKVFRRVSISGRQDEGWLWIFASVLTVLTLNLSTLLLSLTNGRLTLGMDRVLVIDPSILEFVTTFSRIIMAMTMTIGAYMLYVSMKAKGGGVKLMFTLVEPAPEAPSLSEPKYRLKHGSSYLVREVEGVGERDRSVVWGIDLFVDLVTHGVVGLCATRMFPPKVREEYGLMKTMIIWLTQEKFPGDRINPTDLTELSHMIKEFVLKGGDSVVLLEGIEYLILYNNFEDVLKMVEGLSDVVVQHNSRMILTIDPYAITDQQLHQLRRELIEFAPR